MWIIDRIRLGSFQQVPFGRIPPLAYAPVSFVEVLWQSRRDMAVKASISYAVLMATTAALVGATPAPRVDRSALTAKQSTRVVSVTAERFAFFPSELTVEEGTEIEFRLRSEDTAHGFRILGQSIDVVIPKRNRGEASVRFAPSAPGTYVFECSRMCGAGHSFMRGTLRVRAAGDPR
jgi:heme/copper-type cytochrome/quinol oxidase subunit 2